MNSQKTFFFSDDFTASNNNTSLGHMWVPGKNALMILRSIGHTPSHKQQEYLDLGDPGKQVRVYGRTAEKVGPRVFAHCCSICIVICTYGNTQQFGNHFSLVYYLNSFARWCIQPHCCGPVCKQILQLLNLTCSEWEYSGLGAYHCQMSQQNDFLHVGPSDHC